MHKPRIIFFDIDGTLIDMEKKRITERTLDALRRLQQNGILLAIATAWIGLSGKSRTTHSQNR